MASFGKKYRGHVANAISQKYVPYWHTIHPLTFDPIELIYRRGFEEDEWEALQLLRKRRGEVISNSRTFSFHPTMLWGIKNGVPKGARIAFHLPDAMPKLLINDTELPRTHLREIFEWLIIAYRHKAEKEALRKRIYHIFQNSTVNTPGQLMHVWPALVNHLDSRYRGVVRMRKNNSQPPRGWTKEGIEQYQSTDEHQRLDHVLAVLSLTDYKRDGHYPVLL